VNNYAISLIRTYVPVGVGAVAGWLLTHYGLHVSGPAQTGVTAALTAAITGAYYAGVRALEGKWPALGFLLGHTAKPVYVRAAAGGVTPAPVVVPPAK
jgi:hypothetical protein